MHIYALIPEAVKDYIRVLRAHYKYPGRNIGTPHIGPHVVLGQRCSLSRRVELGARVVIGDYTYVNSGTIIASGRIGRFCSIGSNCQIGMANHPVGFLSTSPLLYGSQNVFGDGSHWTDYAYPPEIGSDVWIGAQVFIKQGVKVGHGAIIGAGAVVLKDVPPYAIVAGVPAQIKRYRFSAATIARLMDSNWWERPLSELKALREDFLRPVEPVSASDIHMAHAAYSEAPPAHA